MEMGKMETMKMETVKMETVKMEMMEIEIQMRMIGVLGLFESNLTVKNDDLAAYTQRFQELTMLCTKMVPEEEDRVEKFIGAKRTTVYNNHHLKDRMLEDRIWKEPTWLATMKGEYIMDHYLSTTSVNFIMKMGQVVNQRVVTCYECGRQGHYRNDFPKLKDQNCRNKTGNKNGIGEARGKAYVLGGGHTNPNSNVIPLRFFSTTIMLLYYLIRGIMPTNIELTLEQSQQGVSNDVLVSIEGVEELKRNAWLKGEKKAALQTS
nr:hypothetical protein [Tanacetum cinerariifolium]